MNRARVYESIAYSLRRAEEALKAFHTLQPNATATEWGKAFTPEDAIDLLRKFRKQAEMLAKLEKTLQGIDEGLKEGLSIPRIAEKLGLSEDHVKALISAFWGEDGEG